MHISTWEETPVWRKIGLALVWWPSQGWHEPSSSVCSNHPIFKVDVGLTHQHLKTVFKYVKYVKHVSPQMPKDTSILIWWLLKDSLILTSGQWRLGLVWFLTAEVMRRPLQLSFIPHTLMYWGVSNSPKLALNKSPQGDNSISKCKFQPHVEGTLLLPSPGEQWGFQQTWLLLTLLLFPGSGLFNGKRNCFCGERICSRKVESLRLLCMSLREERQEWWGKTWMFNVMCFRTATPPP